MNADLAAVLDEVGELIPDEMYDRLTDAIYAQRLAEYGEGVEDGFESAKGIYDHTGRAA